MSNRKDSHQLVAKRLRSEPLNGPRFTCLLVEYSFEQVGLQAASTDTWVATPEKEDGVSRLLAWEPKVNVVMQVRTTWRNRTGITKLYDESEGSPSESFS